MVSDEKRVEEGIMESSTSRSVLVGGGGAEKWKHEIEGFQMPLHYPRYTEAEYETMPEWRLDCLLREYGLPTTGDLQHKRNFAIGAFLWPSR